MMTVTSFWTGSSQVMKGGLHTRNQARRAGSDGSMSASGLAGSGFDPRRGSKFSFENFQPPGLGGVERCTLSNR